ncbi:hypothetical protein [Carnobacterium mobile]|uniref:hypothetical protein n=1 Tax=Carnobacterium mobile TaxID=2750 RepID=UPI0005540D08|nr:hypothetical protein [Carnobacterium mobile]
MNKQDLINHIEEVKGDKPHYREQYHLGRWQAIEGMLELIDQLDEPEQVVCAENERTTQLVEIPQFVADYIEFCKKHGWTLSRAINHMSTLSTKVNDYLHVGRDSDEHQELLLVRGSTATQSNHQKPYK